MSESLEQVFQQSRSLLASFADGTVVPLKDEPGTFQIAMKGSFVFGKRKMEDLFLAAVVKNKASVVFHFLPVYMNPKLLNDLQPVLRSKLKGKACFHLKNWDPEIEAAMQHALVSGKSSFETFRNKS